MDEPSVESAKEWLTFADRDLAVAEHLLAAFRPLPVEIICFHCQQAAEKAVKAIIALERGPDVIPRSHDLTMLLGKVCDCLDIDAKYYDYADTLAPYGATVRYPNGGRLDESEATQAIAMAKGFVTLGHRALASRDSPRSGQGNVGADG